MKEKIYFANSRGDKLCGILSDPEKTSSVVILCHGFTSSKDSTTNKRLETMLNEKGIATFRFDFFAHGESEGDFENITISEAVDDILNAIKFLKARGFSKLALVGSSFGGIASIMAASKTNDLSAMVLKSPVSNYLEKEIQKGTDIEKWKYDGYIIYMNSRGDKRRLNYSFFEDFNNNDGYEASKKISIPVLIIHGDEDKNVPVEQSRKTAGILKNSRLEIIEGADHFYSKHEHFERMINLTYDFLINFI